MVKKSFRIKKPINRSRTGNLSAFFFLLLFGVFIAIPIYYSVINAFKPVSELFLFPPRFVVYHPTMDNFSGIAQMYAQSDVPMERYLFNSVFVTFVTTTGYVLIATMAAFPLAKNRFPGKRVINKIVVFAILFRPEVTALPQYILMAKMGMLDTYLALILPALGTSFGVFLMEQFIGSLPDDILEAARIDGAGEKRAFFSIVLPAVKPALLTLVIFTFISSWNTAGTQFTYSESMKLLPTVMQQIGSGGIIRAGITAAVGVLLMIPPILIFLLCQNSVMETMAYSGIKS